MIASKSSCGTVTWCCDQKRNTLYWYDPWKVCYLWIPKCRILELEVPVTNSFLPLLLVPPFPRASLVVSNSKYLLSILKFGCFSSCNVWTADSIRICLIQMRDIEKFDFNQYWYLKWIANQSNVNPIEWSSIERSIVKRVKVTQLSIGHQI